MTRMRTVKDRMRLKQNEGKKRDKRVKKKQKHVNQEHLKGMWDVSGTGMKVGRSSSCTATAIFCGLYVFLNSYQSVQCHH